VTLTEERTDYGGLAVAVGLVLLALLLFGLGVGGLAARVDGFGRVRLRVVSTAAGDVVLREHDDGAMPVEVPDPCNIDAVAVIIDGAAGSHGAVTQLASCLTARGVRVQHAQ